MTTDANARRAPYNWADDNEFGTTSDRNLPPRPQQPPRQPSQPPQAPSRGTRAAAAAGAAAGGFVGGMTSAVTPPVNINVNGKGAPKNGAGQGNSRSGGSRNGVPGADFMSNEDIRAFCEHIRREARNRATERAMDADHLEAVLRTIPDMVGSLAGSRARARRVARWAKKIAAAEKQIQKYAASLYGTFEREYDSNLRTVGKARTQPNPRAPFGWR